MKCKAASRLVAQFLAINVAPNVAVLTHNVKQSSRGRRTAHESYGRLTSLGSFCKSGHKYIY